MIKAKLVLNVDTIVSDYYEKTIQKKYDEYAVEVASYFYKTKIELPIIPQKGMKINLYEFSNELSKEIRDMLWDGNDIHKIKSVIICGDYLELWF